MCLFPHFAVRLRPGVPVEGARAATRAILARSSLELGAPAWMDGPPRQHRPDVDAFFEPCTIRGSFRVGSCGCGFGTEGGHERVRAASRELLGTREVLDVRYAFVWTSSGPTTAVDQPIDVPLVEAASKEHVVRFVRPDDCDYASLRSLAAIGRELGPSSAKSAHGRKTAQRR